MCLPDICIALWIYLKGGVDAADQGVEDVDAFMLVEENEGEESLQQSRFWNAPQEEVQIRRGGHHLLQCQLQSHRDENSKDTNAFEHV